MNGRNPMDTTTIVAIAVAAVFLLILIVWFFSTWNRLINLDERTLRTPGTTLTCCSTSGTT